MSAKNRIKVTSIDTLTPLVGKKIKLHNKEIGVF